MSFAGPVRILLIAVALTGGVTAVASGISGRVIDGETGNPVPYANVGVPGSANGTVGDEHGSFTLGAECGTQTVLVSAIGYATQAVPCQSLPHDEPIALTPLPTVVGERIEVVAQNPGAPDLLGHKFPERGYKMGYGSAFLGAELGAHIRIKKPTLIESAHFVVARTGGERFLYRINVYDFANGEVGDNLLKDNVIVEAAQELGPLSVDLSEHLLVVDHDVLLALEWIKADEELGNREIMFRVKPRSKSNTYIKSTSQMPFQKIRKHQLGFYLHGQPLDR